VYSCYRMMETICTNSSVYTRVWPCIGASYNHLLREYKSIQCSSRCDYKRNHITTYKLLHGASANFTGIQARCTSLASVSMLSVIYFLLLIGHGLVPTGT
jgi:hypothetical protein